MAPKTKPILIHTRLQPGEAQLFQSCALGFGHFNSGLTGAGGAREGSQRQAPERAAPGNLSNMPRALKAREDFSTCPNLAEHRLLSPFSGLARLSTGTRGCALRRWPLATFCRASGAHR